MVSSFYTSIYLTKVHPEKLLGNFYAWMQLSILSSIVLRLGLDIFALKTGYTCSLNQILKVYLKELKNNILIVIITILLSIFYLYTYSTNQNIIIFTSFVFLFIINCVISEFLRSNGYQLLPLLVQNLVIPLGLILFSKHFDLYYIVFVSQVFSLLLQLCVYFLYLQKSFASEIDSSEANYYNKTNIINALASYSDVIVISIFCKSEEVVYYYIALRIANICNIFLGVVNGIIAPLYARMWKQNKKSKLKLLYKNNLKIMSICGLIFITIILLYGDKLIFIFYNENFSDSIFYLKILSIGMVFSLLTGTSGYFLMMTNDTKLYNNILLKNGILSFLMIIVFGYLFHVNGVTFIVAISFAAKNLITFYFLLKKIKTL